MLILAITGSAFRGISQQISKPNSEKQLESPEPEFAMGVPYMGNYRAKPLPNYQAVPEHVRSSVEKKIVAQTGKEFFKQLRYAGGGYVDLDSLYLIEENAKYYQWKPSSYYLCFELSEPKRGISYSCTIEADKRGVILNRIEFPDIAQHPEKSSLISEQDAVRIARANGILDNNRHNKEGISTIGRLEFDTKRKIFVWEYEQRFDTGGHVTFDIYYYDINAHNGKYLGYEIGIGMH
jgi:hypothetical protein